MSPARKQQANPFNITSRDVDAVRFIGRAKLATAEDIQIRFGMARSKAYARLRGLVQLQLLRHERGVPGDGLYLATRDGLRLAGLQLAPAEVSLGALNHDRAVTRWLARLEAEMPKLVVLTEREVRQHVRLSNDSSYRPKVERRGIRDARHWPDLVIPTGTADGTPSWLAVEIELTHKSAERTRAILAGYRLNHLHEPSRTLRGVLYVVPDVAGQRRLLKLAAEAELGNTSHPTALAVSLLDGEESPDAALRRLVGYRRTAGAADRAAQEARVARTRERAAREAAEAARRAEMHAQWERERAAQQAAQAGAAQTENTRRSGWLLGGKGAS